VAERLRSADLLVGNLECVASLAGEIETGHNPFRCPHAVEALKTAGFDLLSIANNHALDYGRPGFDDMLRTLDAAGLPHFGKETFGIQPQAPWITSIDGIRIGLLAYYTLPKKPFADIVAARARVDVLFTFMHWGREDQVDPLPLQRTLAHEMIDAGVDVVVGTHAHVPQPSEWYRGKLIVYGLGNFVFSGMTHSELHRTGQLYEVELTREGIASHRIAEVRLGTDGAPRFKADPSSVAPLAGPAAP
jgi:poly-gamma-glutamate synthesis protein (capsule biosynthesis protein)